MKLLFYMLPLVAGVAIAIQSGINSQLRIAIQHPLMAAFISFIVGTAALTIILMFFSQSLPEVRQYAQVDWYKFTGGLLGVLVVIVTLLAVTEIGASNMFVLIVAGQLVTAVLMDHFGILGMKIDPITLKKILGIVLVICGAYIVNKK